jgi:hypothetical protein
MQIGMPEYERRESPRAGTGPAKLLRVIARQASSVVRSRVTRRIAQDSRFFLARPS